MDRNPQPDAGREPAHETREPAPTIAAPAVATPSPAVVTTVPIDLAAPSASGGPSTTGATSLIPDAATVPGDVIGGEGALASPIPEVASRPGLDDPFGLDLDVGGPGSSLPGQWAIDLPDDPDVADLPRTGVLDVDIDWADLGRGTGTLDGRGIDAFDGTSGATTPTDPTGMVSEGGIGGWLSKLFGGGATTDATTEGTRPAPTTDTKGSSGSDTGTDMNSLTTPGVTVGDDGVTSKGTAPTGEGAGMLSGLADFFMGKKNIDGTATERQKQMEQTGPDSDGLPPDHPDYVGPPSQRPPGSANDESIERSIRQGLGGDRGGDVDPYDDPTVVPMDGDAVYDAHDSLVDPGPDGFMANPHIDESHLPNATDAVAPYLADE